MGKDKNPPDPESLSARFATAHKEGIDSLRAGDYEGLGRAIETEKALIDEQGEVVEDLAARVNRSVEKCSKSDS